MDTATVLFHLQRLSTRDLRWLRAKFDREYCNTFTLTIGPWIAKAAKQELRQRPHVDRQLPHDVEPLESLRWHAGAVMDALSVLRRLRQELMCVRAEEFINSLEGFVFLMAYEKLRAAEDPDYQPAVGQRLASVFPPEPILN